VLIHTTLKKNWRMSAGEKRKPVEVEGSECVQVFQGVSIETGRPILIELVTGKGADAFVESRKTDFERVYDLMVTGKGADAFVESMKTEFWRVYDLIVAEDAAKRRACSAKVESDLKTQPGKAEPRDAIERLFFRGKKCQFIASIQIRWPRVPQTVLTI
jgi:hypothetical protein